MSDSTSQNGVPPRVLEIADAIAAAWASGDTAECFRLALQLVDETQEDPAQVRLRASALQAAGALTRDGAAPDGPERVQDLDAALTWHLRAASNVLADAEWGQTVRRDVARCLIERLAATPVRLRGPTAAALLPMVRSIGGWADAVAEPSGDGPPDDGTHPDVAWLPRPDVYGPCFEEFARSAPLDLVLAAVDTPLGDVAAWPHVRVVVLRTVAERAGVPSARRARVLQDLGTLLLLGPAATDPHLLAEGDPVEAAIRALEEALAICPRPERLVRAAALHHLLSAAFARRRTGDPAANAEKALAHGAAAIHIVGPDAPEWTMLAVNMGRLWRDRRLGPSEGNRQAALRWLQAALERLDEHATPQAWAMAQNVLGRTLQRGREGDAAAVAAAMAAYRRALRHLDADRHPIAHAGVANNLAGATVLPAAQASPDDVEAAIHVLELSVAEPSSHNSRYERARTHHDIGAAYRNRRRGVADENLERAAVHLREALDVLTPERHPQEHVTTSGALGEVEADRGRWPEAHEAFASAMRATTRILDEVASGVRSFDDTIRRCHEVGELDAFALAELGRPDDALDALERARTMWLARHDDVPAPRHLAARVRAVVTTVERAIVYLVPTRWGGIGLIARPGRADLEVLRLNRLTDDLVVQLLYRDLPDGTGRLVGGYGAAQDGTVLGALSHDWPGDSFAAKTAALHDACAAAGVESTLGTAAQTVLDALAVAHPLVASSSLDALDDDEVGLLGALLHDALLALELPRCLRALGDVAMGQVTDALVRSGAGAAVLVPCGLLPAFPLTSAFVDGEQGTAGDRIGLSQAPSVRSLLPPTSGRRRTSGPGSRSGLYAVGDPAPTARPLPWARAEALTAARIAGDADRAQVGEDATVEQLREALRRGRVVVASCHGEFVAADGLRSRLLLAGGRHVTVADLIDEDDDIDVDALILSACQAAVTDLRGAVGEVRSLAAAIVGRGARAVIAPLWAVDDEATYLLVTRFLGEWLPRIDEEGPARSLARAQAWLRTATPAMLAAMDAPGAERPVEGHAASSGRGNRYGLAAPAYKEAERASGRAADDAPPYAAPEYWAGFQVLGR